MNSTPNAKAIEPDDDLIARADEGLAHAYEQIVRADEQIARVNEQVSKLERDAAHNPSAARGRVPSRGRPMLRGLIGLLLAACIFITAFVSQPSHGDAAKLIFARWTPRLISTSSLPMENPGLPAQASPSAVQLAAAEPIAAQPTPLAQTAPRAIAPPAAPVSPEVAQFNSRRWRATRAKPGAKDRAAQSEARNKWPSTMPRPLSSSRRARNK